MGSPRRLLRAMFDAAVAAAQPALRVPPFLPPPPRARTIVMGAGKASAAMAQAVEAHWPGPLEGLVVTRHGHAVRCGRIEVVEAGHPVPDAAGEAAARRLMALARGLGEDDLVLGLFSGGGSALLPLPAEGLALHDEQSLSRRLLASGASIGEMNCVRRHLSALRGGRLAAACHPARVVNLLISDVPGDDPADIASGPTVADATTCADALDILRRHAIEVPRAAWSLLESGAAETIKPADPRLRRVQTHLVATPQQALDAAAEVARRAGMQAHILGDAIEGEARDVGRCLAAIARQVARRGEPFKRPCVLLSGGETTVTLRGRGRGGRNVEFLLSLALALQGEPNVHAIAGDTDGIDGLEEIAGALLAPDSLARARAQGLDPRRMLDDNDGHAFFQALDDSVISGPTLTNVNDFRAIYIA
ncbi:glycerate kinase type-2 family protein [Ideonella sp. BN130291]|uniref:glycerate kinase type-2 family protein n=1 Tax=Ideonella sp. BN130291 TaxID=3112940 RepID=UPI002E263223|nr:glycerate kinase [Ideonella sp. BN130291]